MQAKRAKLTRRDAGPRSRRTSGGRRVARRWVEEANWLYVWHGRNGYGFLKRPKQYCRDLLDREGDRLTVSTDGYSLYIYPATPTGEMPT